MELVKIKASDFGLEESKATEISDMFKPMLEKMTGLEDEFNEVIKLEISEPGTSAKAKALRLKYVKVRTGTAEIHSKLKKFYLLGGRFVDGWKNAQLMASQGNEDRLQSIENHQQILAKEKADKLQSERAAKIEKLGVEIPPLNLGRMPDDVWAAYYLGTKTNYEAQIAAEKKVEEDRIAKEKAEKEERERIRKENERLKKEADERERSAKIEADKREKAEKDRLIREEKERKAAEEKAQKERDAYELKLKAEREEKEKVEAELKARAEDERKAAEEKEAKFQAELNKGDEDKIKDLVSDLEILKGKYAFMADKNTAMYAVVGQLIDKIINHIQ